MVPVPSFREIIPGGRELRVTPEILVGVHTEKTNRNEEPRMERRGREKRRSSRGRTQVRQRQEVSLDSSRDFSNSRSPPTGGLAAHLYRGRKVDMKDYSHLDRFPTGKSRDAYAFVDSFREMLALSRTSDRVMCLLFPTTLVGPALDWYSKLPRESINSYDDLVTQFLRRFGGLRAPAIKCTSLMAIKQEPGESSREFLAKFSEEANRVTDIDEKLVLAAVLQGLRSRNLRYELVKQGCETFEKFRECAQQVIQAEEDAENMGWNETVGHAPPPSRRSSSPPARGHSVSPRGKKWMHRTVKGPMYKLTSYRKTGEAYTLFYSNYHICTLQEIPCSMR